MNKMTSFFLAPLTAFFLPQVYRDASKSSWSRGLLYVVYCSFLAAIFLVMIFAQRLAISDAFFQWVKKESPVLIWTPEGLSFEDNRRTARLDHPVYGPIAVFDMDRAFASGRDLRSTYLFVTSKKIYFIHPYGQVEERDITKTGILPNKHLPQRVRVTGQAIETFYLTAKLAFLIGAPGVLFPAFFIMFLVGNLVYSLAGLLLNLLRKNRLRYGAIFSMTCFATGISIVLSGLQLLGPLASLPWPPAMNFLLGLIYMCAAFTLTDNPTS
ncbi:MAG: DUF1189 family protein [Candidatus Omnitrophota bacterium]